MLGEFVRKNMETFIQKYNENLVNLPSIQEKIKTRLNSRMPSCQTEIVFAKHDVTSIRVKKFVYLFVCLQAL